METDNHETKDKIIITQNGMQNSNRNKKDENDNSVYFGYKIDNIENNNIDYILPNCFSGRPSELQNYKIANENNDKNIFFKIYYNNEKFFLKDLCVGKGTFIKLKNDIIIKENTIVNIGETYLVFSFDKKNIPLEKQEKEEINENDLFINIYSNENEYEPVICKNNNDIIYTVGRSDKCDVLIKDKMLSRVHCILKCNNGSWHIKDGNEEGGESTNGTWVYASDEIEIKDGMVFKSNNCSFLCKYE